jgi:NTE family protein
MTGRALVLGGGGPVGLAWQSGLLAGFAQAGADLGRADFILGTSAGSLLGARLALGAVTADLAEALLAQPARPPGAAVHDLAPVLTLVESAQSGQRNPAEVRRELGALALGASVGGEAAYLAMMTHAVGGPPTPAWPGRGYACTAVDAEDGGFQLWDRASGVDLAAAVASSCSVPGVYPPVSIQGRRYIDGGMRSFTNADIAADYELVVVVAVLPAGAPAFLIRQLDEEVESLKAGGATVVAITPDPAAAEAIGPQLLDPGRTVAAVRAGLAQGASQAAVLRSVWSA